MTSKLTRERIEWLNYAATGLAANGTEMAMSPQDVIALTERCLAAMDSEPVADVVAWSHPTEERTCDIRWRRHDVEPGPLYRHAQPALVVPEEKPMPKALSMYAVDAVAAIAEVKGWNACRAAMLQTGNSPAIPDGYVMVPKEPTGEMILSAMRDNETGSVAEIYELMLAAAPQEVKGE